MNEINLSDYNSLLEVAVALNLGAIVFRSKIKEKLSENVQYKGDKILKFDSTIADLENVLEKNELLEREEIEKELEQCMLKKKLFEKQVAKNIERYNRTDWKIRVAKFITYYFTPILASYAIAGLFLGACSYSFNKYVDIFFVSVLIFPIFISYVLHCLHLKGEKSMVDNHYDVIGGN